MENISYNLNNNDTMDAKTTALYHARQHEHSAVETSAITRHQRQTTTERIASRHTQQSTQHYAPQTSRIAERADEEFNDDNDDDDNGSDNGDSPQPAAFVRQSSDEEKQKHNRSTKPAYYYPQRPVDIGRQGSLKRDDESSPSGGRRRRDSSHQNGGEGRRRSNVFGSDADDDDRDGDGDGFLFPLSDDELASSMTFLKQSGYGRNTNEDRGKHSAHAHQHIQEQQWSQPATAQNRDGGRTRSPHASDTSVHKGTRNTTPATVNATERRAQGPAAGLEASFFSTASSAGSNSSALFDAHSTAEMARIQSTIKDASARMDRYIESLQITINGKDTELQGLKHQMTQLERNYEYNLDIIRERDEALQSASVMIEQKHRALMAAEDKSRRHEERLAEQERQHQDSLTAAKQREVMLEAEVRAAQRRLEDAELKHQHQLHDRDARLERERAEMREHNELRTRAEDEARVAIVHRLEKALADKTALLKQREAEHEEEMHALRAKHVASEKEITTLTEQIRQLTTERESLKETVAKTERNASEQVEQQKNIITLLKRRAEEAEGAIVKGSHEAEAAVRIESSRNAQLTAEITAHTATIANLEQRVAILQHQKQTDTASYATEIERVKTVMRQQIEEIDEQRSAAVSRAETAITSEQSMSINLREIKRLLDDKLAELTDVKAKLVESEREFALQTREFHLLEERLCEAQSQHASASSEWRRERLQFEENERDFGRKWDRIVREQTAEREKYHQQISSLQQDFNALQREFHVSESARQSLQEQMNLIDDNHNGPRKTIDALRLQNRDLNEKVVQLEKANETIRAQVKLFTEEMHNDPLIKQAKEQTDHIALLTGERDELLATIAALKEQLAANEEEIGRYQVSILTTKVEHDSELRSAKAEAKAQAKELFSLSGDDKRALAHTLKEHELWHKKALQLEVVVQKMLKERQLMADELEKLSKKVLATTSERNTLTEANNVLRVQLEEAYAQQSHAAVNARAASVAAQYRHQEGHYEAAAVGAAGTRQPSASPAFASAVAAVNATSMYNGGGGIAAAQRSESPSVQHPSSAVLAVQREQEEKINALELKIQQMRSKTIGAAAAGVGGGGARSRRGSASAGGLSSSRSPSAGAPTYPSATSHSRPLPSSSQPVVRGRSGAAVRHYGYGAE